MAIDLALEFKVWYFAVVCALVVVCQLVSKMSPKNDF